MFGVLMYYFDWVIDDYDWFVVGSFVGYIFECGCQGVGGLYIDWEVVFDWVYSGYLIVECWVDGSFIVIKFDGMGGLVMFVMVGE